MLDSIADFILPFGRMGWKGETMLNSLLSRNGPPKTALPSEGELYKIVTVSGYAFELYYGYYEECDRENPDVEPMPLYPDFLRNPQYTDDGLPFVTKMQDACKSYKGKAAREKDCAECEYYKHGDDFIGMCSCPKNKRTVARTADRHFVEEDFK